MSENTAHISSSAPSFVFPVSAYGSHAALIFSFFFFLQWWIRWFHDLLALLNAAKLQITKALWSHCSNTGSSQPLKCPWKRLLLPPYLSSTAWKTVEVRLQCFNVQCHRQSCLNCIVWMSVSERTILLKLSQLLLVLASVTLFSVKRWISTFPKIRLYIWTVNHYQIRAKWREIIFLKVLGGVLLDVAF